MTGHTMTSYPPIVSNSLVVTRTAHSTRMIQLLAPKRQYSSSGRSMSTLKILRNKRQAPRIFLSHFCQRQEHLETCFKTLLITYRRPLNKSPDDLAGAVTPSYAFITF